MFSNTKPYSQPLKISVPSPDLPTATASTWLCLIVKVPDSVRPAGVDVSGVEERGNAQDDPGPQDWDNMDGLRKGELPLIGQGDCEVHAKTPLRGAGKKEERLRIELY